MTQDTPETCQHLAKLTPKPALSDLPALGKKLRKRRLPNFSAGSFGDHPKLGQFKIFDSPNGPQIEWALPGAQPSKLSIYTLSTDPSLASEKLDIGWIIASMYELDGLHNSDEIPDPREMMKELSKYMRTAEHYQHWAIAPVEKIRI